LIAKSIYERAIAYLARREHSSSELRLKLVKVGFESTDIDDVLKKLAENNLQSDSRFAENYLRYRSNRGYGFQRIRQELKEKGVSTDIISEALEQAEIDWFTLAIEVRCKRFGENIPDDYKDRAKQQRFLQYRGFSHEQINESFNKIE
jgi:regulatory protein